MRRLLFLLLCAVPCFAQVPLGGVTSVAGASVPTYVREVKTFNVTTASSTTAITSFSNSIPSGHEAVLGWKQDTNNTTTVSSVTDSHSNTWTCAAANTADTAMAEGICYSFLGTTIATTDTITITWANSTNSYKVGFVEDVSGTTALDSAVVNTGSLFGTSSSTAQITTSSAKTIMFAMVGAETSNNTYSVGTTSGFTVTAASPLTSGGNRYAYLAYSVVSTAGTYNAVGGGTGGAWSANSNWIGSTIAFH